MLNLKLFTRILSWPIRCTVSGLNNNKRTDQPGQCGRLDLNKTHPECAAIRLTSSTLCEATEASCLAASAVDGAPAFHSGSIVFASRSGHLLSSHMCSGIFCSSLMQMLGYYVELGRDSLLSNSFPLFANHSPV
jgi:hypothetical protein